MNCYGRFRRSGIYPLLTRINTCPVRWARRKYKRLTRGYGEMRHWWDELVKRYPDAFAHSARLRATT